MRDSDGHEGRLDDKQAGYTVRRRMEEIVSGSYGVVNLPHAGYKTRSSILYQQVGTMFEQSN